MGCAYMTVAFTLWASEIPGDSSEHYAEQLISKRKVIQKTTQPWSWNTIISLDDFF